MGCTIEARHELIMTQIIPLAPHANNSLYAEHNLLQHIFQVKMDSSARLHKAKPLIKKTCELIVKID